MSNRIINGSVPVSGSTNGTTGALSVTLGTTSFTGRIPYLQGFTYQCSGATAATTVTITASYAPVSGAAVTLGTWVYQVPIGATINQAPMVIPLNPPMPANQAITGLTNSTTTTAVGSITVSASAAGAGATFAGLSAWGYCL